MPDKIDMMLGNYKKVAIVNIYRKSIDEWEQTMDISLNLSFVPKQYIIFFRDGSFDLYLSNINNKTHYYLHDEVDLISISDRNINIRITIHDNLYKGKVSIDKLIAIG